MTLVGKGMHYRHLAARSLTFISRVVSFRVCPQGLPAGSARRVCPQGLPAGSARRSGGKYKNTCAKGPFGIGGVIVVLVLVRVIVIDPSFWPTRMAADTVDYDYEHEHRCTEHERLGAVSAGSDRGPAG